MFRSSGCIVNIGALIVFSSCLCYTYTVIFDKDTMIQKCFVFRQLSIAQKEQKWSYALFCHGINPFVIWKKLHFVAKFVLLDYWMPLINLGVKFCILTEKINFVVFSQIWESHSNHPSATCSWKLEHIRVNVTSASVGGHFLFNAV